MIDELCSGCVMMLLAMNSVLMNQEYSTSKEEVEICLSVGEVMESCHVICLVWGTTVEKMKKQWTAVL